MRRERQIFFNLLIVKCLPWQCNILDLNWLKELCICNCRKSKRERREDRPRSPGLYWVVSQMRKYNNQSHTSVWPNIDFSLYLVVTVIVCHNNLSGNAYLGQADMDTSMAVAVQRLAVCLPMQGTWAQSLIRGGPTYQGATKPMWLLSLCPGAWEPQLLKPGH